MNLQTVIEEHAEAIQALKSELINSEKRCDQYAQAYESLKNQMQELLRNRFGKKSERYIDPESPQLSWLENNQMYSSAEAQGQATTKEEILPATNAPKKKAKSKRELRRRIEIICLTEGEKTCSCGACKTVIRHEIKELISYQPAVFEILEQRREVGACPNGCEGAIVTAPVPTHILPKVKATEEFLSFLVVSKLDDRQPLYHLESQLNQRYGIDCSRQTMARWLIDLMTPMQPIYNLLVTIHHMMQTPIFRPAHAKKIFLNPHLPV